MQNEKRKTKNSNVKLKITDARPAVAGRGIPDGIRVLKSDDSRREVISSARFARSGLAFILAAELRGILPEIIKIVLSLCCYFFRQRRIRLWRALFTFHFSPQRGFSLVETIVYIGLLGMISVLVTNALIQITSMYQRARAEREVVSNARLIMETITKNISYARETYALTSKFNIDTGQLSLVTPLNPLVEHTTAYIDFWTDGNQLLMRREGGAISTLSSANVRITQFRVEQVFQGLRRQSVKIILGVSSNNIASAVPITLNATASLRGNY